MEEWRDVVGYESLYQVSSLGRVRTASGAVISPRLQNGYPIVNLTGHKIAYVHRLIVAAFVGPIPRGMQTHHKNGDRADNRLDNLELLTVAEHQHREFILRCSQLRPIGPGGGMAMFDRSRGYTPG